MSTEKTNNEIGKRIDEIDELMQVFRKAENMSQFDIACIMVKLQNQKNELTRLALSLVERDNISATLGYSGAARSEQQKPEQVVLFLED